MIGPAPFPLRFVLALVTFWLDAILRPIASERSKTDPNGQCEIESLLGNTLLSSETNDDQCHGERFNVSRMTHHSSAALSGFVGIWRSQNLGRAFFPTIPKFKYGEQLEIGLSGMKRPKRFGTLLEYRAVAWGMNQTSGELHSEFGYIVVSRRGKLALNTAMSNGFITVEEGRLDKPGTRLRLRSVGIDRMDFAHDFRVTRMVREWTLLEQGRRMESRLSMETDPSIGLREHTIAIYEKVYP